MLLWTRVYTSKVSSTVKVDFSMSADVQSACLSRLVWLIYDRHRYSYHCSHPNPAHPHPHPYTPTGLNWTLLTTPCFWWYTGEGGWGAVLPSALLKMLTALSNLCHRNQIFFSLSYVIVMTTFFQTPETPKQHNKTAQPKADKYPTPQFLPFNCCSSILHLIFHCLAVA